MANRKTMHDVLHSAQLKQTIDQVQLIDKLNALLPEVLSGDLAEHIQIANFNRRSITIIAQDAEWATRARFAEDDILFSLQQHPFLSQNGIMLGSMKIMVRPESHERTLPQRQAKRPSKNSSFRMIESANNLSEDLAKALKKLAGRAK